MAMLAMLAMLATSFVACDKEETYLVQVTAAEGGTVEGQNGEYKEGEKLTFTATPSDGYRFSQWSDSNTNNPRYITVHTSDIAFEAQFAQNPLVTVTAGANGTVSGPDNGRYAPGSSLSFTAIPADGYRFVQWSNGSTENPRTIHVGKKDITFTAQFAEIPAPIAGQLTGAFSVGARRQIYFSQGNLQYQASTDTWRFAEHQYDCIGSDNSEISSTYTGWIDLFGWGTSGYNNKYPYTKSYTDSDYGDDSANNIAGTQYDWGEHNAISNGGNQAGLWRTLTYGEWDYLLYTRTNAWQLWGLAQVAGVNGCIFLPDGWNMPAGLTFQSGDANYAQQNNYTVEQWAQMEAAGAVFLPAAGFRLNFIVDDVSDIGNYWSGSAYSSIAARYLFFCCGAVHADASTNRYVGKSVRLVRDL